LTWRDESSSLAESSANCASNCLANLSALLLALFAESDWDLDSSASALAACFSFSNLKK
jgi:hypothetical protein